MTLSEALALSPTVSVPLVLSVGTAVALHWTSSEPNGELIERPVMVMSAMGEAERWVMPRWGAETP